MLNNQRGVKRGIRRIKKENEFSKVANIRGNPYFGCNQVIRERLGIIGLKSTQHC